MQNLLHIETGVNGICRKYCTLFEEAEVIALRLKTEASSLTRLHWISIIWEGHEFEADNWSIANG